MRIYQGKKQDTNPGVAGDAERRVRDGFRISTRGLATTSSTDGSPSRQRARVEEGKLQKERESSRNFWLWRKALGLPGSLGDDLSHEPEGSRPGRQTDTGNLRVKSTGEISDFLV